MDRGGWGVGGNGWESSVQPINACEYTHSRPELNVLNCDRGASGIQSTRLKLALCIIKRTNTSQTRHGLTQEQFQKSILEMEGNAGHFSTFKVRAI